MIPHRFEIRMGFPRFGDTRSQRRYCASFQSYRCRNSGNTSANTPINTPEACSHAALSDAATHLPTHQQHTCCSVTADFSALQDFLSRSKSLEPASSDWGRYRYFGSVDAGAWIKGERSAQGQIERLELPHVQLCLPVAESRYRPTGTGYGETPCSEILPTIR